MRKTPTSRLLRIQVKKGIGTNQDSVTKEKIQKQISETGRKDASNRRLKSHRISFLISNTVLLGSSGLLFAAGMR